MSIELTYSAQDTVLSQGLADMLNSSVLKDVELACSEGSCLQAHRLILATFSPYFRQVLAACKEPTPTILLPDVSVTVMEVLLEFMHTGNVRMKKDLVCEVEKANKLFRITGLDKLLLKHVGSSLPPNKRQRVEKSVCSSAKPSTLFRPWDSPVLPPRPDNHLPWIPFMYGITPLTNSMPFQMAHGNNLSKSMSIPMSAGSSIFSEATSSLPITMMPWLLPYGHPNLSVASQSLPIHVENPFSETASMPVIVSNSISGEQLNIVAKKQRGRPKKGTSKIEVKGPKARYLVPGKERCDICNCDYLNVASHKKASHGLLKKPIECCGVKFVTGKEFKLHRKTHKY